jgi:hypothetical protein
MVATRLVGPVDIELSPTKLSGVQNEKIPDSIAI